MQVNDAVDLSRVFDALGSQPVQRRLVDVYAVGGEGGEHAVVHRQLEEQAPDAAAEGGEFPFQYPGQDAGEIGSVAARLQVARVEADRLLDVFVFLWCSCLPGSGSPPGPKPQGTAKRCVWYCCLPFA